MVRIPPLFSQLVVPSSKPPFNSNSSGLARVMVLTASDIRTVSEIRTVNREAFKPEGGSERNTDISKRSQGQKSSSIHNETAEKEVQDTSCRGSGGVPQLLKSPKIGGYRGLIVIISVV